MSSHFLSRPRPGAHHLHRRHSSFTSTSRTSLSTFILTLILSLLLVLTPTTALTLEKGQAEGAIALTTDDFSSRTSQGMWLVEHYSPFCGHCRTFAPTFEKLVKENHKLENTRGFFMAQVNCIAQGDLCNSNGVKYYPMIKLYADGKEVEIYSGDRTYQHLNQYIQEHSLNYTREHGKKVAMASQVDITSPRHDGDAPNPSGEVLELDSESLRTLLKSGPAYVEFYAPWCGHCQKLAPKWTELAMKLKGKLNVGKVNCDEHRALCKKEKVLGYPTIKMFNDGGETEYMGPRTVDGMETWAKKTLQAGSLTYIEFEEWNTVAKNEDVYFMLLQTYGSNPAYTTTVKETVASLAKPVPVYQAFDPRIFTTTAVDPQHGTVLLAFKDHSQIPTASLTLTATTATKDTISSFIEGNRQPLIIELTAKNYDEIFKSPARALVVLVALKKSSKVDRELVHDLEKLKTIARAWYKGGRKFAQPVWFVWADGNNWRKWFSRTYGISNNDLPAALLVDPPLNEYYDATLEREPLRFDGPSIFSTLEGVYQHVLRPKASKTTLHRGSRSLSLSMHTLLITVTTHPILSLLALAGTFAFVMYGLQRVMRKGRHTSGHHGQGIIGVASRLD